MKINESPTKAVKTARLDKIINNLVVKQFLKQAHVNGPLTVIGPFRIQRAKIMDEALSTRIRLAMQLITYKTFSHLIKYKIIQKKGRLRKTKPNSSKYPVETNSI